VLLIIAKAGVTGLAAIIGSRPFDVPSWLPPILLLAATFVDYPPPLNKIAIKGEWNATPQTKKKIANNRALTAFAAFDSFWTSHRSTWPSVSKAFNTQQIEVLTELFERIRSNSLCV
jgi:hypothetical protein